MARAAITGSHGELVIEREVIPVHYLSDIDANWTFTDTAGHRHHCEYEAAEHYPTLVTVVDETYWCEDCEDEHELTHQACRLCGEKIRPGTTGPGTKYITGVLTCTLDGEPISRERADQVIAEWQAARG